MATVTLEQISKTFGKRTSLPISLRPETKAGSRPFGLHDISLTLPSGQTTVILGPSGCGKTTLLRIIAGLVTPDSGRVYFGSEDVTAKPPRERRLGMVFQDFALYPHFTAKRNILAHFFFKGKTPELDEEAREKYRRTSDLMGVDIAYLLERKPNNLSKGEQQRVALARCITRDPALFLLDEPFSSLDQGLREKYRVNLKRLLSEFHVTTVYVTHDQQEALLLADRIVVMDVGHIVQVGNYRELYQFPKNRFVANFLNPDPLTPALNVVDGSLVSQRYSGKQLGVRPEDVTLVGSGTENSVAVTLTERLDLPTKPVTLLTGHVNDRPFHASIPHPDGLLPEQVWFRLEKFHVFDQDGVTLESYP